jgi:putative transposase
VLTTRAEVADRMLIFGQRHLQTILAEYEARYNGRRPYRSCQLHPPRPDDPPDNLSQERIQRPPVLGARSANTNESPQIQVRTSNRVLEPHRVAAGFHVSAVGR